MNVLNTARSELLKWKDAILGGRAESVAELYLKDAVLIPTMSPGLRIGVDAIEEYFSDFIRNKIERIVVVKDYVANHNTGGVITYSGEYEFELKNGDKIKARFTFNYVKFGSGYKILSHHSSLNPA